MGAWPRPVQLIRRRISWGLIGLFLVAGMAYQNCAPPPDPELFDKPVSGNCRNGTDDCDGDLNDDSGRPALSGTQCSLGGSSESVVEAGKSMQFFLTTGFSLAQYPGYKTLWYIMEADGTFSANGVDLDSNKISQSPPTWQFNYGGAAGAPFVRRYFAVVKDASGRQLCDTRGPDASAPAFVVKTFGAPTCTFSFAPALTYIPYQQALSFTVQLDSGMAAFPAGVQGFYMGPYSPAAGTQLPMPASVINSGTGLRWSFFTAAAGESSLAANATSRALSIRSLLYPTLQAIVDHSRIEYVTISSIKVKTSDGKSYCTTKNGAPIGIQL